MVKLHLDSSLSVLTKQNQAKKRQADGVALEIFKAKARINPPISLYDRVIQTGKFIFFPITLAFIVVKFFASKLAYFFGVGANNFINERRRLELRRLGGEEIQFKAQDDITLEGMFFDNPSADKNAKTVIICSGSHQSYEFFVLPQVDALLNLNCHVLVFNYRGFGLSKGSASEEGFYLDTEAAYQYVQTKKQSSVVALGYSMGGACATDLAVHHKEVDLFLDRSFSSMKDVAKDYGGNLAKWIFQLGGASFDVAEKIDRVKGKILIVRGKHDKNVKSYHHTLLQKRLVNNPNASFIEVNSDHFHLTKMALWFHQRHSKNSEGKALLAQLLTS